MNWLADKIEQWPTAKLLPYARNARTHSEDQVAQIAASIAEFGFTNPILAGSDGIIVAGHGRLAAAQKLGLEQVPVVVLDPFGGSGTTLIAAEKNGRLARLMELDPRYCDVTVRRWQSFTGQAATLEGDGRTFDEVEAERGTVEA